MKKSLVFSFSLLLLSCILHGQSLIESTQLDRKCHKKYEKALQMIRAKENSKAIDLLVSITEKYPNFYEGRYKLAWQYLRVENKEKSILEFEEILQMEEVPDYKLVIALTNLYEEKSDYNNAIETISYFIDHITEDHKLWDYALRRKAELAFRMEAYRNPLDINPIALGPEVNSNYSEYLPAFNASGSEMIFTRRLSDGRSMQEDLYINKLDENGQFTASTPIAELNTVQNEGAHCFSQDGNILIFTSCDRDRSNSGCDLYISFRNNGKWSEPTNMGSGINTRYWESQPALSADNKTLYFSSSRNGGYGSKDIWYVQLGESGWSEPINMGPTINSPGNEGSPFLHPDGKTFYFRSDGHIGLGDYDLFISRKVGNNWSEPINMAYPINSMASEGALFVELKGKKAYYTSDQFNADNNLDILYFNLPEKFRPEKMTYLLLKLTDKSSGDPLQASLQLTSVKDTLEYRIVDSTADGEVLTPLSMGDYILHVNKEGYLFHSSQVELWDEADFNEPLVYHVQLETIPIDSGVSTSPIVLKNIFFKTGSAILLNKSMPEIKALVRLINDDNRELVIVGHTDNVGKPEDNLLLSEKRAKAVYDALMTMGVNEEKVHYEGRGEQEPLANNETEEGRAKNRRTEFYLRNND